MKILLALIVLVAARIAWWWFIGRNIPKFPPIHLNPADPEVIAARQSARDSVPRLRELFVSYPKSTNVKVPFVTTSGTTEFLWAQVLNWESDSLRVLYLTPPATHTGRLEREHTHPESDIADWVVQLPTGKYIGGFSMRVMFAKARELYGTLPPILAKEEPKYQAM